jgi:hypothetical protein
MGRGLRERWAVGKEEGGRWERKTVIFGETWVLSGFAGLNQTCDSAENGTYVHIRSSGGSAALSAVK